ncbi:MAG: alpha/beta fold hydrolase [Anaerolineae bacterium]|nr:alpha/beta fold hydrolase [Anaerolineae bacterium]
MVSNQEEVNKKPKRGCVYWLKLGGFGLLSLLIVVFFAYPIVDFEMQMQPAQNEVCCFTPADFGFDYEDVTFTGGDGLTLSGWYIPSQNGAVIILLHGYSANRMQMIYRSMMLAEHGYGVLTYDLRGHGESEGDHRSLGWEDPADVAGALAFVKEQPDVDPERIGVLGFSVGGQIALTSAAAYPEIAAVVAEEPGMVTMDDVPPGKSLYDWYMIASYRFGYWYFRQRMGIEPPPDIVDTVDQIAPRPILFIAAYPEDDLRYRIGFNMYELAGEPKSLWHIPEITHGGAFNYDPEEYESRIIGFFDEALDIETAP